MQCANPCSLILNIEGATDHPSLKIAVEKKKKFRKKQKYLHQSP